MTKRIFDPPVKRSLPSYINHTAGRADEAGTALAEAFHLFDHRGHLRAPEHFRARRVGGLYLVAAAAGGKKVKAD